MNRKCYMHKGTDNTRIQMPGNLRVVTKYNNSILKDDYFF